MQKPVVVAPVVPSRRAMLNILPAAAAGCLGCLRRIACAQELTVISGHSWTEQAGMTWEETFRFAFQQDLIPTLKELAAQTGGREKFVAMLKNAVDRTVERKTAGRPPSVPNLTVLAASLRNIPPLIQHALEAQVVEQSPDAFAYRVTKCLWAKTFLEEDAGDIGYAYVCYPDYAVARGLNPKLRLIRTKTLMQGDDHCELRYVMDA